MSSSTQPARPGRAVIVGLLVVHWLSACSDDGNDGGMQNPPPPVADTTPPTVSAIAPVATFGTITLTANANDDRGVTQVEFFVDGASVGIDMTAPYSIDWNSSAAADGAHPVTARATDAAGNATTSVAVNIEVRNNLSLEVMLAAAEEWPVATPSAATGAAELTVNLASGAISGSLALSGLDATAAHIHDGHAGQNGPVLVGLALNSTSGRWELPAGASLTAAQVTELLRGGLYLNAHSSAHPGGEIRGQIRTESIDVYFTPLDDSQSIVPVRSRGGGRAALTVDRLTRAAVAHVALSELGSARAVQLRRAPAGVAGPIEQALTQDTSDPTHWLADPISLSQTALDALAGGGLYFVVETDTAPDGELRGQLAPEHVVVGFASLLGLQEVPAVNTAASGTGAVTVNRNTGLATIHVTTQALNGATAAHLHGAFGGRNGSILIGLNQDGSNPAHWSAVDQPITTAGLEALTSGGTYLNAHTPAHPGGEIRGQVLTPGVLFIAGRLSGLEEVPARDTAATGSFALTIARATRDLVLHANTTGVDDAVAAHLHEAYAGTNGPVEIGLTKDENVAGLWSVTGVQVDTQQLAAIESGASYVNVHTPANPGGEIRGQVVPDDVRVVFTAMSGNEEVPAVAIDASGTAATTVALSTRLVTVHARTSGVDDAVQAHVHRAARGTNGPVRLPLEQEPGSPGHWFTVEQIVDEADIADFLGAQWYVNVHTPAHPDGAIRGQIGLEPLPPPDVSAPTVALSAVPPVVSGMLMLGATATDDTAVASVRFYVNGNLIGSDESAPYELHWDTTSVPNGAVTLSADARDAAGNVGQSAGVAVTVQNVVAATLSQLQAAFFTPRCSSCHFGGGGQLPASMNLSSSAASYAALVNVASVQQPTRPRVVPNDAAASYLVRKLEGGPAIVGDRMPLFAPALTPAEIDMVKSWINAGAPNN